MRCLLHLRMARPVKTMFAAILLLIACVLAWGMFTVSKYWAPRPRIMSERNDLTCEPGLLQAAHDMLNGELMPLPFGSKSTRWKFKERVPVYEMFLNTPDLRNYCYINDTEANKTLANGGASEEYMKARKQLITFADRCCEKSKRQALTHAVSKGGFDNARLFNMSDLTSNFRRVHNDILKLRRGAGYWLWKPYVMLKTLVNISDIVGGDLVMYQDADYYFVRPPEALLKEVHRTKTGIVVFGLKYREGDYTKRDAVVLMDMDFPEVMHSKQRQAGYFVVRKTCSSIQFFMEWLAYLSDSRLATDSANTMGLPNDPKFIEHRHDQSVISLLSKRWGLPTWLSPQDSCGPGYPTFLKKYRRKN